MNNQINEAEKLLRKNGHRVISVRIPVNGTPYPGGEPDSDLPTSYGAELFPGEFALIIDTGTLEEAEKVEQARQAMLASLDSRAKE